MFYRFAKHVLIVFFLLCPAVFAGGTSMSCGLCLAGDARCGWAPLLEDDADSGVLLLSLPTVLRFNSAGVRASQALSAWQIGLRTDLVSVSRVEGSGSVASDPPNWITWANEDCSAVGVGTSLRSQCQAQFSDAGIIGICFVTSFQSGEILETTAILRRSYQEGGVSESRKLAVVIHEVGHCLGLKHTNNQSNIMFASVTETTGPSPAEFAAIKDAYEPLQSPSTANRDAYYDVTSVGGNAKRHFTFPVFTISSELTGTSGFQGTTERLYAPFDERGPTTTTVHSMRADGSCASHSAGLSE